MRIYAVTFFNNPMWGLRDPRNRLEHDKTNIFLTKKGMVDAVEKYLNTTLDDVTKNKSKFTADGHSGARYVEVISRSVGGRRRA